MTIVTQKEIDENVAESVSLIRKSSDLNPEVGVILGSGTGDFTNFITDPVRINYKDIPHFASTTVEGHPGNLVLGRFEDKAVAVCEGRFHFYEGLTMHQVAYPVRVLNALGAGTLIQFNAAGGIKRDMQPGDLMIVTDFINRMSDSPLRGVMTEPRSSKFVAMNTPFDESLSDLAFRAAIEHGLRIHRGTYVAVHGPSYETNAELGFFHVIGGDAVGMSTVPELIVARHLGMKCLAISVITNLTFGSEHMHVSHEEVLRTARGALPNLREILKDILEGM
ncbi:purine-nucleoside phosphorylase [bacterium]|nr:purine-nucleoside phosphorylase [bacterium]